jgi:LmbE family N-acetylglucosaminyl deacetylase
MLGFSMAGGRPPKILGLFAHPDDEVFCMGGLAAKAAAEGAEVSFVSLTRGEAGQIRDVEAASRRRLGEVRERELAAAAAVLGVNRTRCLDYHDGTLADQPRGPIVDRCASIIDEFAPDVVVSFGPDGGYGHPDHVAASEIATEASGRCRSRLAVFHAVFPRRETYLTGLIVDWLQSLDERFRGSVAFAHGLMLLASGSSMLGYAADHIDVRFFPPGTAITEQGEPAGELFVILAGNVDVYREAEDGTLRKVDEAEPGSFIGEDGILSGKPRNAHVVANGSVTCLVLAPGRPNPAAGRSGSSNLPTLIESVRDDDVPEGCVELDVRGFATQKLGALARHRSQYAIRAEMFPDSIAAGLFGFEYFVDAGASRHEFDGPRRPPSSVVRGSDSSASRT